MRIGEVIGTVTLSRPHPSLTGFRFVIGVPFSAGALRAKTPPDGDDVVIYDDLGARVGSRVAFSESGEAAAGVRVDHDPEADSTAAVVVDCVESPQSHVTGPGVTCTL